MADTFSMEFGGVDSFSATHHGTGESYSAAGSAEVGAMHAAAAAALGPIASGTYLPALGTALSNLMTSTRQLADVHHAIGNATTAAKLTHIALDNS